MELRRPHPTSDFDQVLAVVQEYDRAIFGDTDWTEQELREEWNGLDLDRDAWVAVDAGRVAGVVHVAEVRGGRIVVDGYVHPESAGRGVGAALLAAAEQRGRELEPSLVPGERVYVETAHLVGDPRAPSLLSCRGYTRVRSFFRMTRPLEQAEPPPAWPAGLELRPFDSAAHGPAVHAAIDEAFVSEWSHHPQPYAEWEKQVVGWARFDPELILVVWDGDEVAAVSLNFDKKFGDWGWIGTLAVRSRWRRRGLGLALLREGFRRFSLRGEAVAALGVDSENPTGATRLYERAGMRMLWQADVWQKELRGGG